MKSKKFTVGKAYYIKFLDHSVGIKGKMEIDVIGWCVEDHSDYLILSHWMVRNDDKDIVDNNHEPTSIIKSCILKKRILNTP